MNGETVKVPNFQISFLLKVKAIVPSFFESAVGVCINPTCPKELNEELELIYELLYAFMKDAYTQKKIKKKFSSN